LLHRDRRRGRRLLAGLRSWLTALGEGALDDAEAESSRREEAAEPDCQSHGPAVHVALL
jgi:hypothetical protein